MDVFLLWSAVKAASVYSQPLPFWVVVTAAVTSAGRRVCLTQVPSRINSSCLRYIITVYFTTVYSTCLAPLSDDVNVTSREEVAVDTVLRLAVRLLLKVNDDSWRRYCDAEALKWDLRFLGEWPPLPDEYYHGGESTHSKYSTILTLANPSTNILFKVRRHWPDYWRTISTSWSTCVYSHVKSLVLTYYSNDIRSMTEPIKTQHQRRKNVLIYVLLDCYS